MANTYNRSQWCEFTRVRTGRWLVFASRNTQVFFHERCSDDFLIAVVAAATHGGYGRDEWNPVWPAGKDVSFTDRLAFSDCEPRHVAWLCDAPPGGEDGLLAELRTAPLSDWEAVAKAGAALALTSARGGCVTMHREYRYGLMAAGGGKMDEGAVDGDAGVDPLQQCFVSIGYEGMDLSSVQLRELLDSVLRAKRNAVTPTFAKTRFSDADAVVPQKRTLEEIFYDRIAAGDTMDGLDSLERYQLLVPPGGCKPQVPDADAVAAMVGPFCSEDGESEGEGESEGVLTGGDAAEIFSKVAPNYGGALGNSRVERRAVRLLNEMVMAWLHCVTAPALRNAALAANANADLTIARAFADALCPNRGTSGSIDNVMYKEMTGKDLSGRSAMVTRIVAFLKPRVSPAAADAADAVGESACLALLVLAQEVLEIAANWMRDSRQPLLSPAALRMGIAFDEELLTLFASHTLYFYFPVGSVSSWVSDSPIGFEIIS